MRGTTNIYLLYKFEQKPSMTEGEDSVSSYRILNLFNGLGPYTSSEISKAVDGIDKKYAHLKTGDLINKFLVDQAFHLQA